MKPNLKNLALYEAYGNFPQKSNGEYTKTIGLVNRIKEIPNDYHKVYQAVFNKAKTVIDIAAEVELTRVRSLIEENVVNMLASVVSEGDKQKMPVFLGAQSISAFMASYTELRQCEKRLVNDGYPKKFLNKGS